MTAISCTKRDIRPDVVRLGAHNLALDNEVSRDDDDDDDCSLDRCRGLPGEEGGEPPPVQQGPDPH